MKVLHIDRLPEQHIEMQSGELVTRCLGKAGELKKIAVTIDTLPPGTYSSKFHYHTRREDFYLILSGTGILKTDEGDLAVSKGNFVPKPCGEEGHQFYNSGGEPLVILNIGSQEPWDICVFPKEGVRLISSTGEAFDSNGQAIPDWNLDPNA